MTQKRPSLPALLKLFPAIFLECFFILWIDDHSRRQKGRVFQNLISHFGVTILKDKRECRKQLENVGSNSSQKTLSYRHSV